MCGFSGFVAFGDNTLNAGQRRQILVSMGQALAPRGPDDQQFFDDGVLSLVFRRLSIVGGKAGRQPIFNETGEQMLVCNGEIYNHAELRQTLNTRHHFLTPSDCEVLLHGFEEWDTSLPGQVRGMFALALWNKQQRRLFLARDRLGIKPLYVCELANGLLFGSELKALLAHPQCPRQTDWAAMETNPLALANTPSYVKGIDFLPGGSYLLAEHGRKPLIKKYWRIEEHIGTEHWGDKAQLYIDNYDHLLQSATLEHLQGQGPVGIHLSGGLDSALLTAIVGGQQHDARCYTIVKRTSFLVGDVDAAQGIAKTFKLPWHPVLFDYQTLLGQIDFSLLKLEQSVRAMDSPLFDIEWIIKAELNRAIRTLEPNLKILLLGQGADEFAGGYSKRVDCPYDSWSQYLSNEVLPQIGVHFYSSSGVPGRHTVFSGHAPGPSQHSPYQQWMKLMVRQLQHHNLWHEDRTSAQFGMEARVPFLDHRIIELLASVPATLHAELFWNKRIVRESMKRRAPGYDLARPKVGFCWTNDCRTLEIIIHSMASLVSQEFEQKYMGAADFAFDRDETMTMMRRVLAREPGFYADSVRLLNRMAATIFNSLHTQTTFEGQHLTAVPMPSRLEVIGDIRWEEVRQYLLREPVLPFPWQPDHRVCRPQGTHIQCIGEKNQMLTYALMSGETTFASIQCAAGEGWTTDFLNGLNQDNFADFTVQDWLDELELGHDEFENFLNMLFQCGFVITPVLVARDTASTSGTARSGPGQLLTALGTPLFHQVVHLNSILSPAIQIASAF